jgi:hypothetical protein
LFGGDINCGCRRLAEGLGAVGAVAVVYRGMKEEAEIGMTFAPGLSVGPNEFRQLTEAILAGDFAESLKTPNKACVMFAQATEAESVILFVIRKDGTVSVSVSEPKPAEFVAAFSLGISNNFDSMN